jgi:hypothetical protein
MPRNPKGPFLQRKIVTKRPTTTGGRAIPVFMMLTRILLPGNLERAMATPTDTPSTRLIKVAVTDTFNDRKVIPITSESNVNRRMKAFFIPSKMRSICAAYR